MHSPSARALRHLDRYCIVLVRTLKHVSPAKCVITITYRPREVGCPRNGQVESKFLEQGVTELLLHCNMHQLNTDS